MTGVFLEKPPCSPGLDFMRRTYLALAILALPLSAAATQWKDVLGVLQKNYPTAASQSLGGLSDADISQGLKAALAQGTRAAVSTLGQNNGYWSNPAARVPLPPAVAKAEKTMKRLGLGSLTQSFHLSLNRAAEQAVPVAAEVFADAVSQLSLQDVRGILTGPKDSATAYFRRTAGSALTARFMPLVQQATAKAGVASSYKQMTAAAGPFAAALGAPPDLDGYVTQKALDALFLQVAAEEARIRDNPAARGSEILKKVFGGTR